MKDSQNDFYSSISNHYSEIFPYKTVQLEFVKNQFKQIENKRMLDIGCATGELSYQLANKGADVTGIDLNPDLIEKAKQLKKLPNLHFRVEDMLDLKNNFQPKTFDAVLCFGNTLVHLLSTNRIRKMMEGINNILKTDGKFLLQILNYDFILNEKVTELPLIETENLRFIRKYVIDKNDPVIQFQTELVFKKEGKSVSNSTPLLALRSKELLLLLNQAGFKNAELFSNFKEEAFGGNHLPLVASAKK